MDKGHFAPFLLYLNRELSFYIIYFLKIDKFGLINFFILS